MIFDAKNFQDKETRTGTVMVLSIQSTKKKDGSDMTKLIVSNGQTTLTLSDFDRLADEYKRRGVQENMPATITARKNGIFFNVVDISASIPDGEDVSSLIQTSPIDVEAAYGELISTIQVVSKKSSITTVALHLLRKYKEEFIHSAAAVSHHHNYIGGLLQHTLGVVRLVVQMCKADYELDRELMICGAALHDIGKIKEYDTSDYGLITVTKHGNDLGHIIIGIQMVTLAYVELGIEDEEKELQIEHMIASHHGELEWGAAKAPAYKEALYLHNADVIDSRMFEYKNAYQEIEPGEISSAFVPHNSNHIRKPVY